MQRLYPTNNMITEAQIQAAAQKLAEVYQPEAIYLFGSYAWGEPTEDSDVDFLIVVPNEKELEWNPQSKGKSVLRYSLNCDVDLIINHQSFFDYYALHPSSIQHEILSKGKKVYGYA